jgi:hypothetical protein
LFLVAGVPQLVFHNYTPSLKRTTDRSQWRCWLSESLYLQSNMSGALKVCNGRPPQLDGWQAKAMISAPQLVPAGNSIITLYGSNVMVNQKKKNPHVWCGGWPQV